MSDHNPVAMQPAGFWQGAKDSQAIIFTYLPVSFAFGVSATQFGFTAWEALFLSCSMYAGASQFLVVALLGSGTSIWMTALTVIALDIRHLLYGPALQNLIQDRLNLKKTAVWAWGLTDEVFASGMIKLSQRRQEWSESWMLGLSLFSWLSWATGSFLGGLFAGSIVMLFSLMPKELIAALAGLALLGAIATNISVAMGKESQRDAALITFLATASGMHFLGLSSVFWGICIGLVAHFLLSQKNRNAVPVTASDSKRV